MYIKNEILTSLVKPNTVVGIFGARRTGKTFLMQEIEKELGGKVLMVQVENLDVSEILSSQRLIQLKRFTEGVDYLFIDEAQKIPEIGINLKLMIDNISNSNGLKLNPESLKNSLMPTIIRNSK
ncbi:MAG: AAA family ATPase [Methanomicrobiales archaeon]